MPRGRYIKKNPSRDALKKSLGREIHEKDLISKTKVFRVPKKLRGIENQGQREKEMYAFLKKLPDAEIQRVIDSYGTLERTPDGETLSQVAALIKMERKMRK